jgi:hypothetical protein
LPPPREIRADAAAEVADGFVDGHPNFTQIKLILKELPTHER